jgi:sulfide:quinone oxidoreductase
MAYQRVNKDLSVAGQLQPGELGALREAGFRSIICNRPDGEAPDQPSFGAIEEQARKLCMQARYLPVVPGAIGAEHGVAFGALLAELPKPILGYCRTGRRSATLWALSESGRQPVADILAATMGAGFDLGELAARMAGDVERQ